MTREDFLQGLEDALRGEIPAAKLDENLRYYDTYIQTQVKLGKTEAEVMDQLGDPRLIARTIIDVSGQSGDDMNGAPYASYGTHQDTTEEEQSGPSRVHRFQTNSLAGKIGCLLTVIALICIVWVVLSGVVRLVSYFALPIILVLVVVVVVTTMRNR